MIIMLHGIDLERVVEEKPQLPKEERHLFISKQCFSAIIRGEHDETLVVLTVASPSGSMFFPVDETPEEITALLAYKGGENYSYVKIGSLGTPEGIHALS